MNIYGSLMDIYDQKTKTFLTKKNNAPAQPRKGLFMNIFDEPKREAQI